MISVGPRMRLSRTLLAIPILVALALGGCGGSGSSGSQTTSSAGPATNRPRGLLRDPKVQACLRQQGITVPAGRRANRPPVSSAQAQKIRAALQKCGVMLPGGGGPPGGGGAPPARTTTGAAS